MNDDDGDSLDDLNCDLLVEIGGVQVAIWRPVRSELDGVEAKQMGRFIRIMEMWCCGHRLTKEMWNSNEGRSAAGRLVQAIKAFKVRLYGFVRQVGGKKTFIIVDVDPAKKQDKADPNILKRAKTRADDLRRRK